MKTGEIHTFAEQRDVTGLCYGYAHNGKHTDPQWGAADAAVTVESGKADVVYVVKILAVVRRSAKVE